MFVEQLRCAVEASPRSDLAKVVALIWRAFDAGSLADEEAQSLAELAAARQKAPLPPKPVAARIGARPRTSASLERRRRWAASGAMPPAIACRFTVAELAVLAVMVAQVRQHGACQLTIPHIAALAGVSETSARNAFRAARAHGLITIQERRQSAWRNLANVVTIIAPEWLSWLRLHSKGGRVQKGARHEYSSIRKDGVEGRRSAPYGLKSATGGPREAYCHSSLSHTGES